MRSISNHKRLMALIGVVFTGLFITSMAFAISGSVPNTFVPNTVAKASEVNANFTFVNYGNIVVRDYNGIEIGALLSVETYLVILNSNDYRFRMDGMGSVVDSGSYIYYETTDCTGSVKYVDARYAMRGSVFRGWGPPSELYYVPKTANYVVPSVIASLSMGWSGPCVTTSIPATSFYQIIPNDSEVTGVTSSSFPGPVTIERR